MPFNKKISRIQDKLLRAFDEGHFANFQYVFKYNFILSLLNKDWFDIIGSPLCNFTKPTFIKQKTLYVSCQHNGMIQALNFKSNEILKLINEKQYGLNFEQIKFVPFSAKYMKNK